MKSLDYQAKTWLSIGFAYACERQIMSKNLVHYIAYQINEPHLGPDWVKELKKYAELNKLRPFDDIIDRELRTYEPPDHLTVFAMVSYLYTDPSRFVRLVLAIKGGQDDRAALKEVYGLSVLQLQV
ncbi:MAG: hypothetical protein IIB54_15450, partial [Planctomycetes bacterium]|nr:hypothetical protein [Planctomycetota bacterium]